MNRCLLFKGLCLRPTHNPSCRKLSFGLAGILIINKCSRFGFRAFSLLTNNDNYEMIVRLKYYD